LLLLLLRRRRLLLLLIVGTTITYLLPVNMGACIGNNVTGRESTTKPCRPTGTASSVNHRKLQDIKHSNALDYAI